MALHNKDTSFFDSRGTEAEDSEQEEMLAGDEEGGKRLQVNYGRWP